MGTLGNLCADTAQEESGKDAHSAIAHDDEVRVNGLCHFADFFRRIDIDIFLEGDLVIA